MKYRAMIKMAMLAAVMFSVNIANAALITGTMGVTGSFSAADSMGPTSDLSLATEITLVSVTGTSGSGDIANVMFGDPGTIGNGNISLTSFASVANLFTMVGWTLDLTSMSITDQSVSLLSMGGSGLLSGNGNGHGSTGVNWEFSTTSPSNYSMTITAVPVPAAIWLFGSGLLGLAGIARRKIS